MRNFFFSKTLNQSLNGTVLSTAERKTKTPHLISQATTAACGIMWACFIQTVNVSALLYGNPQINLTLWHIVHVNGRVTIWSHRFTKSSEFDFICLLSLNLLKGFSWSLQLWPGAIFVDKKLCCGCPFVTLPLTKHKLLPHILILIFRSNVSTKTSNFMNMKWKRGSGSLVSLGRWRPSLHVFSRCPVGKYWHYHGERCGELVSMPVDPSLIVTSLVGSLCLVCAVIGILIFINKKCVGGRKAVTLV